MFFDNLFLIKIFKRYIEIFSKKNPLFPQMSYNKDLYISKFYDNINFVITYFNY